MRGVLRLASNVSSVQRSLGVEFTKPGGTPQLFADSGVRGIEKRPPCRSIFLVEQLGHGKLVEVGIAEKFSAIVKRTAKSLGRQMNGIRRAAAQTGQIVAFQNVERFQHRDTTGAGRRRADDLVSAIRSAHRRPLFDFILRQVLRSHDAAAALYVGSKLAGHGAFIEVVGVRGNAREGAPQFSLPDKLARLLKISLALEDALGIRKLRQLLVVQ